MAWYESSLFFDPYSILLHHFFLSLSPSSLNNCTPLFEQHIHSSISVYHVLLGSKPPLHRYWPKFGVCVAPSFFLPILSLFSLFFLFVCPYPIHILVVQLGRSVSLPQQDLSIASPEIYPAWLVRCQVVTLEYPSN